MKPRLFAAALALLALTACAPAGGFSSPPAVSPSASAMLPEQSPSPGKPSGEEPPEEAAGQLGEADSSAPLALRRWDGPRSLRGEGFQPVSLPPDRILTALDCRADGVSRAVTGEALQSALAPACLPGDLLWMGEDGTASDARLQAWIFEDTPLGGSYRDMAVLLVDYGTYGPQGLVLFFLRQKEGWQLTDGLALDGMSGFQMSLPEYSDPYAPGQSATVLGNGLLLKSSSAFARPNTWAVVRVCGHGTGYLGVQEHWYNLYTGETEITAVLREQESELPGQSSFAYGLVECHDMSMLDVFENVSSIEGDIYSGGNYREQSGVWARRYILNTETCRLEQTVEKYLPCLSLAAARATELN